MNLVGDVLLALASFALRTQFLNKAVFYGRIGVMLCPEDVQLREIYAYALLLEGRASDAAKILEGAASDSRNIAFLRMSVLMQEQQLSGKRDDAINAYLRWERMQ